MPLIITLPAPSNIPDLYLGLECTARDVVLAIHETYYPGSHELWFTDGVTLLAKLLISRCSETTQQIYALGQGGLTVNNITNIGPGAVKVYE